MANTQEHQPKRVLVAGATGYLGRFVVQAFKERGHHVRVLTRDRGRLAQVGPFGAQALTEADYDEVFVVQALRQSTLAHRFVRPCGATSRGCMPPRGRRPPERG